MKSTNSKLENEKGNFAITEGREKFGVAMMDIAEIECSTIYLSARSMEYTNRQEKLRN